jgi:rhamnosyltransferase
MKISIVIPVKNGAQTLDKCLSKIRNQTIADIEIIVLDSISTDNSKEIALNYNAKIIEIADGTFNHGLTRNLGVQHTTGELIYLTVQDAWMADNDMLEKMAKYFEDSDVQSVTGMQATPHEIDKNPAKWFKRYSEPVAEIRVFKNSAFDNLSAKEQLKFCRSDDVNTMYRKSALLEQPFIKTDLSEDIIWAKQALKRGWKIIRDPSLVVYHYHHHTFGYTFKVCYAEYYVIKNEFNILPAYPSVLLPFLKNINTIFKNSEVGFFYKPWWVFHNATIHLAQFLSVFVFRFSAFFGGGKLLNKGLQFFCSSVPQGRQLKLKDA